MSFFLWFLLLCVPAASAVSDQQFQVDNILCVKVPWLASFALVVDDDLFVVCGRKLPVWNVRPKDLMSTKENTKQRDFKAGYFDPNLDH